MKSVDTNVDKNVVKNVDKNVNPSFQKYECGIVKNANFHFWNGSRAISL